MNMNNIIDIVTKKNRIKRMILCLIGNFIATFIYNAFIVPNHIVYGGVGGLAILVNQLTGISTTLFINIVSFSLIFISFLILGLKNTSYSLVGFIIYDIMITVTAPIASHVTIQFDSFLFSIIVYSLLAGVGYGLIYKTGFNTGGSDVLIAILQKFFKVPIATISNIMNGIIIVLGATTFGIVNSIYAILYLKLTNLSSDKVLIGASDSKIVFIHSKKKTEIEEILTSEFNVSYTLLNSTNGIGILPKAIILCVIPSQYFYNLKQRVTQIDKKCKIISNDCYTVIGGTTNHLIHV